MHETCHSAMRDIAPRHAAPRYAVALGLAISALLVSMPAAKSQGADPGVSPEVSKEVIAVQIRKQGFECKNPERAERAKREDNTDDAVWLLTCEGVRYKVQLIPKMAAKVERLPAQEGETLDGASNPD